MLFIKKQETRIRKSTFVGNFRGSCFLLLVLKSIMQVTPELLRTWFDELNDRFYGSELPVPRLETGNSRTALGTMRCRRRRVSLLKWQVVYTIRVSNYYERSYDDFRNVLLHEMIHYYIAVKKLKDTSPHGRIFRQLMEKVNAAGWHVSVSERRAMSIAERNLRRVKPAIVLSMRARSGARLLTVVNSGYVTRMENRLRRQHEVVSWQWHTSTDAMFNSWPRVRTLRARRVCETDFHNMLGLTEPLDISSLR